MRNRKQIAVFWMLCLLSICLTASAAGAILQEPVVEPDTGLSTGQVTQWSCITFGAYPQTEIVPVPSSAVDDYAVQDGDFLVDPALYEQLAQAPWQENETEIGGVRYLRMNREGAVTSGSDRVEMYRWGEEEWHYFRYDPIRWRVLRLEEGKALLMADRLLDCQPYSTEAGPVTWDASAGDEYGNVFWITRTTGYTHANVVYVDESGYIYNRGILVTCPDAAVIPALILELNADVYDLAGTCTIQ